MYNFKNCIKDIVKVYNSYSEYKEKHVLFVNGKGFNWDKEDHFRLVYLADCDKLKYATESLRDFLENYNPKIS